MWAKLDDEIWMNPKFVGLRDNAQALWLRSLSLVGKLDTGGFLPKAYLPLVKATRNGIKQLVDAGLWETTDGGFDFHDWEKYNLTEKEAVERVAQRKRDKADRQARWREKLRLEAEKAAQAEAAKQAHVDAEANVYTAQNGVSEDAASHTGVRSEPEPVPGTRIGDTLRVPPPLPTFPSQNETEASVGGSGEQGVSPTQQNMQEPLALVADKLPPGALMQRFFAEHPNRAEQAAQILRDAKQPVPTANQAMYLRKWMLRVVAGQEPEPLTPAPPGPAPARNGKPSASDINAEVAELFGQFQGHNGNGNGGFYGNVDAAPASTFGSLAMIGASTS